MDTIMIKSEVCFFFFVIYHRIQLKHKLNSNSSQYKFETKARLWVVSTLWLKLRSVVKVRIRIRISPRLVVEVGIPRLLRL